MLCRVVRYTLLYHTSLWAVSLQVTKAINLVVDYHYFLTCPSLLSQLPSNHLPLPIILFGDTGTCANHLLKVAPNSTAAGIWNCQLLIASRVSWPHQITKWPVMLTKYSSDSVGLKLLCMQLMILVSVYFLWMSVCDNFSTNVLSYFVKCTETIKDKSVH